MTSPNTQRALAIPYIHGPFIHISRPIPVPGPGDVLVKVTSVGLNPVEWKIRSIIPHILQEYPALVGTDGAGTVVELGSEVKGVSKGDRVFFQGWYEADRSTFQEYTLVYGNLLAKTPDIISDDQASTIPVALATAAFGLAMPYPKEGQRGGGAGLKPFWEPGAEGFYQGKSILILGGSTAVGQFVIQIAKYLGFSPIIATSSLKHANYLKDLGATHIVDRNSDIPSSIKDILETAGEAPEIVYDAVNTPITQAEVDLVSPGGTLISIWQLPPNGTLNFSENRKAVAVQGSVHVYKEEGTAMYERLTEFLEKGILKPLRVEKVSGGLSGIVGGLERLKNNQVSGVKLVIEPAETL